MNVWGTSLLKFYSIEIICYFANWMVITFQDNFDKLLNTDSLTCRYTNIWKHVEKEDTQYVALDFHCLHFKIQLSWSHLILKSKSTKHCTEKFKKKLMTCHAFLRFIYVRNNIHSTGIWVQNKL
jgi:hypothetical protein